MPLIVDREQVRQEILHALQQCLEEKASSKGFYARYRSKGQNCSFKKSTIILIQKRNFYWLISNFFAISYKTEIEHWYIKYKQNNANLNESSQTIVKHFIKDMVLISHQNQSWAFTQISTMGQYNTEIRSAIKKCL